MEALGNGVWEAKSVALKIVVLAVVLIVFSLLSTMKAAAADEKASFVKAGTTKVVTVKAMARDLKNYDVVVFGEYHDSQPIHDGELAVLKELYRLHGDNLVLSMEMFERDVQPVMNQYLAGDITEEAFLAASRPWPQYDTAYKPMVEFAKAKGIPVLTGNIPRRMASAYAKARSLDGIAKDDVQYLPKVHKAGSQAYREKFAATMKGMNGMSGGMQIPPQMIEPMFMAQCLKDDAMAESIADYRSSHPQSVIYHVVGNFHSEGHLGLVEKTESLRPDDKVAVIDTVHYDSQQEAIADLAPGVSKNGEYLAFETAHAVE